MPLCLALDVVVRQARWIVSRSENLENLKALRQLIVSEPREMEMVTCRESWRSPLILIFRSSCSVPRMRSGIFPVSTTASSPVDTRPAGLRTWAGPSDSDSGGHFSEIQKIRLTIKARSGTGNDIEFIWTSLDRYSKMCQLWFDPSADAMALAWQ